MPTAETARPEPETLGDEDLAALVGAKAPRPGPRFVGGALAGAWVGLAAALSVAPWGPAQYFGHTRDHSDWILGMPAAGALLVALTMWIPSRLVRSLVLGVLVPAFGLVTDGGRTFTAFSILGVGLAAVGWTIDAAVSPPWFARGRARALLVVLAATTTYAAWTAAQWRPAVLPDDAGPWWILVVLGAATGVTCLVHAAQDARGALLVTRVGGAFEERPDHEGAVDAIATPGVTGRVYLGRLPVRQGRGAYRAGEATVPVVQILAPPRTALRWLTASALGLVVMAALLFALAAETGSVLAKRNVRRHRILAAPASAEVQAGAPARGR